MKLESLCSLLHQHADMLETLRYEEQIDTKSRDKLGRMAEKLHRIADGAAASDEDDGMGVYERAPRARRKRTTGARSSGKASRATVGEPSRRLTRSMAKSRPQKKHDEEEDAEYNHDASD